MFLFFSEQFPHAFRIGYLTTRNMSYSGFLLGRLCHPFMKRYWFYWLSPWLGSVFSVCSIIQSKSLLA